MTVNFIVYLALMLASTIFCVLSYKSGIELGYSLASGNHNPKVNNPFLEPLKSFKKESKTEEQKEIDDIITSFNNIMSYDGTPQKKEGEAA